MRIIAGLGNPGQRYQNTRHNAGFMLAESLRIFLSAGQWKPWHEIGEYVKTAYKGSEFFILRPLTYMNDSGRAAVSLSGFYKIPLKEILVCFDDVSIALGEIRIRKSGSCGGHKGMENIISAFSCENIARLRIGVGNIPEKNGALPTAKPKTLINTKDFVLSKFPKNEIKLFESGLEKARQAVLTILDTDLETAMNKFN